EIVGGLGVTWLPRVLGELQAAGALRQVKLVADVLARALRRGDPVGLRGSTGGTVARGLPGAGAQHERGHQSNENGSHRGPHVAARRAAWGHVSKRRATAGCAREADERADRWDGPLTPPSGAQRVGRWRSSPSGCWRSSYRNKRSAERSASSSGSPKWATAGRGSPPTRSTAPTWAR